MYFLTRLQLRLAFYRPMKIVEILLQNALVYNDKMLFVYVVCSWCQLFIFVTILSRG